MSNTDDPNVPANVPEPTPEPTVLPAASELPAPTPLGSAPVTPEPVATVAPAATQAFPPLDPNAPTQAFTGHAPPPAGPGAPAAPAYGAPAPQAPMNTLAIVAFVGSFFVSLVGIIVGHIALKQVKRDGTRGRGLALAGTIIGYVSLVFSIIGVIIFIVLGIFAAGITTSAVTELGEIGSSAIEELPGGTNTEGSQDATASSDFCAVFEEISMSDASDSEAAAALYERLANAAPSEESRVVYQKMADFVRDPALLANENELNTFSENFTKTLLDDALACF